MNTQKIVYNILGKLRKKRIKINKKILRQNISRKKRINYLVEKINESAFIKIKDVNFAKKLMAERMSDELLFDDLWNNLSLDKQSGELFEYHLIDPTLTIIFVNIDFLLKRQGNKLEGFGKSVNVIKELIKIRKKLESVPIYYIKEKKVGEGNHRIKALYELGYKSCPVYITQGWD